MKTLDSLLETVENYEGIEEETKSENGDMDFYNVLTFGDVDEIKNQGHELPYSDGQRRNFSFEQ